MYFEKYRVKLKQGSVLGVGIDEINGRARRTINFCAKRKVTFTATNEVSVARQADLFC